MHTNIYTYIYTYIYIYACKHILALHTHPCHYRTRNNWFNFKFGLHETSCVISRAYMMGVANGDLYNKVVIGGGWLEKVTCFRLDRVKRCGPKSERRSWFSLEVSFAFWSSMVPNMVKEIAVVLFFNDFYASGEQPEQRVLAHTLWQPTSDSILIFHKYCCFTKHADIISNLILRNPWRYTIGMSKYHNAGMDQKMLRFVLKNIAPGAISNNPH